MTPVEQSPPPFQAFLDEHAPSVLAFLRAMVGPNDAEDCLQETFLAALRAYTRAKPGNLRAWVLTIARRKAIDHHRARVRQPVPVADAGELAGSDPGAKGSLGMGPRDSAIWAAVSELPPTQRAAVVLRFAVDLRYREVGAALGCSEDAARQSVHEALKKLRLSAEELKEEVTA